MSKETKDDDSILNIYVGKHNISDWLVNAVIILAFIALATWLCSVIIDDVMYILKAIGVVA